MNEEYANNDESSVTITSQEDNNSSNQQEENEKINIEALKQQLLAELTTNFNQSNLEKKKKRRVHLLIYLVTTILICSICCFATAKYVAKNAPIKVIYQELPNENSSKEIVSSSIDISQMVETVENSIVEIYTETVSYNAFFGQYVTEGAGSGVIFTTDGYIVTNNHVIENSKTIKVKMRDGKEYDGKLVATDSKTDLAVVKIEANDLQPIVISSSDKLKSGQQCVAIGNPLGTLGGSVTTGIISAPARDITIDGSKMTLLQIDASINPGNSGGGLFNASGQLIGIVNAKGSGNNIEGIGFAIPVSIVKDVVSQLIENGYVIGRAQIGIKCTSIDSIQIAWQYGVNSFGVYVNEVTGENAKKAGIMEGDVIIGIDEMKITSFTDMKAALNNYSANDEVEISLVRGKETIVIKMILEQKTNEIKE